MTGTIDRAVAAHLVARATGQRLAIARECERQRRKTNRKTGPILGIAMWALIALVVLASYAGLVVSLLNL